MGGTGHGTCVSPLGLHENYRFSVQVSDRRSGAYYSAVNPQDGDIAVPGHLQTLTGNATQVVLTFDGSSEAAFFNSVASIAAKSVFLFLVKGSGAQYFATIPLASSTTWDVAAYSATIVDRGGALSALFAAAVNGDILHLAVADTDSIDDPTSATPAVGPRNELPAAGAFGFPDAELFVFTGNTHPPYPMALVTDIAATPVHNWQNVQGVNGNYFNIFRGRRIDINFSMDYHINDIDLMFQERPPSGVHMHLRHLTEYGSAGFFVHSGQITSPPLQGANGTMMRQSVSYFANHWNGYRDAAIPESVYMHWHGDRITWHGDAMTRG